MGKAIAQMAPQRGHAVAAVFDVVKPYAPLDEQSDLSDVDVCIDFSLPDAVLRNVELVCRARKNMVIGSSGWYEKLPEVERLVKEAQIGCIYASNFSLGVNLFFQVIEEAARRFNSFPQYDVFIQEAHHRRKKDSPSGTAWRLGQIILEQMSSKNVICAEAIHGQIAEDSLHIASLRAGTIHGTHTVGFDTDADTITLTHTARSRDGFTAGAIQAAEWIVNQTGFYTMRDLINSK
jgi:4-hydroxy-tetrahydrodipicolinate reductase